MFVGSPRHLLPDSPPPNTLSDNHSEPVFHPRMISRSEHIASNYVRSSLAFHMSCHAVFVRLALYLLFLPPPSSIDSRYDRCWCFPLCSTTSSTTVYPYRRASRQAVPLHLSHISPICLYLSVALGICCCYVIILFKSIACHCRP